MSDARWEDVALSIEDSVRHFRNAVRLREIGTFTGAGIEPYRDSMALTHAIQSGHTSAEAALAKVLDILGEERPGGEDWHKTRLNGLLGRRTGRTRARRCCPRAPKPISMKRGASATV